MISNVDVAKGLHVLGVTFAREITPEVIEVYRGVLADKLDPDQWEHAVRRALESERFFPAPAVLLGYAAPEFPLVQAAEDYERIVDAYELGQRPDVRAMGHAAHVAFVSAGGNRAFAWCEPRDEPFRRARFVEGWREAWKRSPALALAPAPERQEIPRTSGRSVLQRALASGEAPDA